MTVTKKESLLKTFRWTTSAEGLGERKCTSFFKDPARGRSGGASVLFGTWYVVLLLKERNMGSMYDPAKYLDVEFAQWDEARDF